MKKHGSYDKPEPDPRPEPKSFAKFKSMLKEHGDSDECLLWGGRTDKDGYGIAWNKKSFKVHRQALIDSSGREGVCTRHKCKAKNCFNPKHLEWGTHKQNAEDRKRDGTHLRGEDFKRKLTSIQVAEIFLNPGKHRDIAAEYDISYGMVGSIKSGRSWSHVTDPLK